MNAANSLLPRYGALAKRTLDEMIAGARVDVAPYKRDAADFVLWKPSKPGEPSWPSPSGIKAEGRPGWHVECSAMAWKHLGEQFDIHGGGIDLVFPHHENELAQTCCAFHAERMANVWMHNGFLQVEGDKMSKSLGNFVTIRELLETDNFGARKWEGSVLRYAMLSTHYTQPIDWTSARLHWARKQLSDFSRVAELNESAVFRSDDVDSRVISALSDDLNTPAVIAELNRQFSAVNHKSADLGLVRAFLASLDLLGLNVSELSPRISTADQGAIEIKIARRNAARSARDFEESDRIRDELVAMGVMLKDGKDPITGKPTTAWEIKR
jgi:cysteinyl-tRNA synthetase